MRSRRQFLKRAATGVALLSGAGALSARAGTLGPVLGVSDAAVAKPSPISDLKPLRVSDNGSPAPTPSTPTPSTPTPSDPTPTAKAPGLAGTVARDSDLRAHPDVLAYVEFKDATTVLSDLGRSNWSDADRRAWYAISNLVAASGSLPKGATFPVADPEFIVDRGLPFMRFSGTQRLIAAHLFAPQGTRHAFCRYVLVIESDAPLYITDGVKLPGFAGEYEDTILHPPHAGTQTFSWRMEHGPKEGSNISGDSPQPPFSRRDYLYDGSSGGGFGVIKEYGGAFPIGVPITIEQELDVDAKHGRVWVDGVLIGERDVITDVDIEELFLNVYHGGTGFATQPIHYRLAGACIATSYIGVPAELRSQSSATATPASASTIPAWRQGLPVGKWVEVAGTSLSTLPVPAANIDAWCGLAALDDAASGLALWVSAAGGGHSDSNDNGVYGIDWKDDAPAWYVMCPPSGPADRVSAASSGVGSPAVPYAHDGKPNSCHTYWSLVWCPQRGRIFRPFSSALWFAAQGARHMDGFDPLEGNWDAAGTWPDCVLSETQALVTCDPATGDIYYGSTGTGDLYKWTQATNEWGRVHVKGNFGYAGYHGGTIDATRNRLVRAGLTLDGESLSRIPVLDLATGAAALVPTGIGDPPLGARSIVHDTRNDLYYLTDSVNVYSVDPDTFQGTRMGPLPLPAVNGAYSRFAYFAALGGIFYYPSFAQNVWFMATE